MDESKPEQQRAKTKRDAIHEATVELLLSEGMRAVTHRQVAAKADVPVGSIGYYFSSREKLIMSCFERVHGKQTAILENALADPQVRTDRRALAAAVLDLTTSGYPDRVRSIISATIDAEREGPELQKMVIQHFAEAVNGIDQLLDYAGLSEVSPQAMLGALVGSSIVVAGWDKPVVETTIGGMVQFLEMTASNAPQ